MSKNAMKVRPFWLTLGIVTIPFFACRHANLAISNYGLQMLLVVIVGFVECFKQMNEKFVVRPPSIYMATLIGVLILHSMALGDDSNFGYVISYGIYFSLCLISLYLRINKTEIKYLIYCYVLSSTIIAVLMFISPYLYYGRYSYKFANGPPFEPNYLAFYFVVAFVMAIYKLLYYKGGKYSNYLMFGMAILNAVAALATGSRNALIGVLLATSYFAFRFNENIARNITLAIIFIITIFSLDLFIPDAILNRIFNSRVLDESNSSRISHWLFAIQAILSKPILGYGVITSPEAISSVGGPHTGAHNTYFEIWLNLGFWGVFCLLGCYYDIVKNAIKKGQFFCVFAVVLLVFMEMVVELDIIYSFWFSLIVFLKGSYPLYDDQLAGEDYDS